MTEALRSLVARVMLAGVLSLNRQQRTALATVLLLLVLGWAVKAWRLANPPGGLREAGDIHAEPEIRTGR
jgi:hypothetical protein